MEQDQPTTDTGSDPYGTAADARTAGRGSLKHASWLIALAVWRFARVEERWSARLADRGD